MEVEVLFQVQETKVPARILSVKLDGTQDLKDKSHERDSLGCKTAQQVKVLACQPSPVT